MLISKKLKPGQPGTKRLVTQYGGRLVCVRYRYDDEQRKRLKTVELIVEESFWQPPAKALPDDEIVGLRVGFREVDLQRRVKTAGGKWNPGRRLWEIRYGQVVSLGLTDRVEPRNVSDNGKPNVSIEFLTDDDTCSEAEANFACSGLANSVASRRFLASR